MLSEIFSDDHSFSTRLLKARTSADGSATAPATPELSQWLEYWNDADSVAVNLRRVEHWLQRARQHQPA